MRVFSRGIFNNERSALLTAPVLMVLVYIHLSSEFVRTGLEEGYWERGAATANSALLLIAPVCAGISAWEMGRMARGGLFQEVLGRPLGLVVVRVLTPAWLLGVAALLLSWMIVARFLKPEAGAPDAGFVVVGIGVLTGYVALGGVAGRFLPRVVAVPACLGVAYLWLVFPPAFNTPWVRHLTGVETSCCFPADRLDAGALWAPVVVAVGVGAAAGSLLMVQRIRPLNVGCAGGVVVIAVSVAIVAVHDLGYYPGTPRPVGDLRCAGTAPEICLWPENQSRRGEVEVVVGEIAHSLRQSGVPVPDRVSESVALDGWVIAVNRRSNASELRAAVALGAVPAGPPECAVVGQRSKPGHLVEWDDDRWPGHLAVPLLEAWILEAHARLPRTEIAARYPPEVADQVDRVIALDFDSQLSWYEANLAAATTCDSEPALL